eukprot:449879-Amphidinium_carterae.1
MEGEFLCLVAPALGVSGENWATAWREALRQSGLLGRKEAPAIPATSRGVSLRRPYTHAELGHAFRKLMARGG